MKGRLSKSFDEEDWRLLVESIRDNHQVIPVVGAELSCAQRADGTEADWLNLISEELGRGRVIDPVNEPLLSHNDLRFLQPSFVAKFAQAHQKLFMRLRDGEMRHRRGEPAQPGDLRLSEPLRLLAKISDFPLFATTAPDGLLALALCIEAGEAEPLMLEKADWSRHVVALNVRNNTAMEDADLRPAWTAAPESCTPIYHLFGLTSFLNGNRPMNDSAQLGAVIRLAGEKPHSGMLRVFAQNRILLLGTRTPDCLTASFIRLLKGTDDSVSILGETFIARPEARPAEASLIEFLVGEGTTDVLETEDAAAFIIELHRLWQTSRTSKPVSTPAGTLDELRQPPTGCIFLSYASEDRAIAQQVYDTLTAKGLPVWFDRVRLEGGEPWDERMHYAVEKSRLFLPIISPHSAKAPAGSKGRYYLKEWTWASLQAPARTGNPYIFPLFTERLQADGQEYIETHFPLFHASQGATSLDSFLADDTLIKLDKAFTKAGGTGRFLAGPHPASSTPPAAT